MAVERVKVAAEWATMCPSYTNACRLLYSPLATMYSLPATDSEVVSTWCVAGNTLCMLSSVMHRHQ